jgi:hypothetical protein
VQCCSYCCRSSFYSLDDGCTGTLKLQHQPYFLDTSQPRMVLHLLLKTGFAFSFPFVRGCDGRTHDAQGFQVSRRGRQVCHRVPQPRVRFAAAPPPVKTKQHHHSLCKSDMIFGANVEWLSWFEAPRSPGALRNRDRASSHCKGLGRREIRSGVGQA